MEIRELGQINRLSDLGIAALHQPVEGDSLDSQQIDASLQNLRDDLQRVSQLIRILEWLAAEDGVSGKHG